jgi:hypothetical protein
LEEIDKWALAELNRVLVKVLAAYEAFEFHSVYHALYNFATVTLSARYFDIIKDRLYTFAPRSKAGVRLKLHSPKSPMDSHGCWPRSWCLLPMKFGRTCPGPKETGPSVTSLGVSETRRSRSVRIAGKLERLFENSRPGSASIGRRPGGKENWQFT